MDPIEIIDGPTLASYAGVDVEDFPTILVDLTNGLVTEKWKMADPTAPVPTWVKGIALEVGARRIWNPKGLSSWTRSISSGSRTERLPDALARAGIFLTPEEAAKLAGVTRRRQRFGSIRTRIGY